MSVTYTKTTRRNRPDTLSTAGAVQRTDIIHTDYNTSLSHGDECGRAGQKLSSSGTYLLEKKKRGYLPETSAGGSWGGGGGGRGGK